MAGEDEVFFACAIVPFFWREERIEVTAVNPPHRPHDAHAAGFPRANKDTIFARVRKRA